MQWVGHIVRMDDDVLYVYICICIMYMSLPALFWRLGSDFLVIHASATETEGNPLPL